MLDLSRCSQTVDNGPGELVCPLATAGQRMFVENRTGETLYVLGFGEDVEEVPPLTEAAAMSSIDTKYIVIHTEIFSGKRSNINYDQGVTRTKTQLMIPYTELLKGASFIPMFGIAIALQAHKGLLGTVHPGCQQYWEIHQERAWKETLNRGINIPVRFKLNLHSALPGVFAAVNDSIVYVQAEHNLDEEEYFEAQIRQDDQSYRSVILKSGFKTWSNKAVLHATDDESDWVIAQDRDVLATYLYENRDQARYRKSQKEIEAEVAERTRQLQEKLTATENLLKLEQEKVKNRDTEIAELKRELERANDPIRKSYDQQQVEDKLRFQQRANQWDELKRAQEYQQAEQAAKYKADELKSKETASKWEFWTGVIKNIAVIAGAIISTIAVVVKFFGTKAAVAA